MLVASQRNRLVEKSWEHHFGAGAHTVPDKVPRPREDTLTTTVQPLGIMVELGGRSGSVANVRVDLKRGHHGLAPQGKGAGRTV